MCMHTNFNIDHNFSITVRAVSYDVLYLYTLLEELFKYTKIYDLDLSHTFVYKKKDNL